jgi:tetratricopeptide (TPR) repeat protein
MENLELIENYFKGINGDAQKYQFEKRILEDASFAEEVAFYISANGAIQQQFREEKKQRFREIYNEQKVISIKQPVRNMWRYMAAASVFIALVLITWFLTVSKKSTQQLADIYIQQHFQTLSVTMGNQDSLQAGLNLFNSNKLTEALTIFETLIKNNPKNSEAKKYAGIVSLRLNNYNKALEYFTILEADSGLYSNPGKFYKAITLLKRNKDGDKGAAKLLLKEVRDQNLEGKNEAVEWLEKLN